MQLYRRYRDNKQNAGEVCPEKKIKLTTDFVDRSGIEYPVEIAHNSEGHSIGGIPTMIFIDRDGTVADYDIGSGNEKYIRQKSKEIVGETATCQVSSFEFSRQRSLSGQVSNFQFPVSNIEFPISNFRIATTNVATLIFPISKNFLTFLQIVLNLCELNNN